MSYRETPRIAAEDGRLDGVVDDVAPRPRLRRFEFVRTERQLDIPRVLVATALFVTSLALVGYLGTEAVRTMVRWLHQQPQYQVRFLDIRLQDEPPTWFRGGAQAFLRQVQDTNKESEVLPVMELEPKRIISDFRLFPWVDEVTRVEYPPHGITVHLLYKQPVAKIPYPPGQPVILDSKASILPAKDIDGEKLGPLIWITGNGLDQSALDNQPGLMWKSSAPGADGPRLEHCVCEAARLAGFLQDSDRAREAAAIPALRVKVIHATERRGLFIQNVEDAMIFWGEAPGSESSGNLEAHAKWEILKTWAKTPSRRALTPGDYWIFSRNELKPVETGGAR